MQNIFEYLNVHDLLSCSAVSTAWNSEARRVLQKYRKCTARIWYERLSREELSRFNTDVSRMSRNPFNGLDIFHHCWENKLETYWKMEEPELPENFNLKFLTIRSTCKSIHCPAFRLIMKILYTKLENLEELVIIDMQHDYSLVRKHYNHLKAKRAQCLLPKLRILDIGSTSRQWWDVDEVVVGALVSQAPNLQELRGSVHMSLVGRLSTNQLHTVKSLVIYSTESSREWTNLMDVYDEFSKTSAALKTLYLSTNQFISSIELDGFLDATCNILEGNSATLEEFETDSLGLIILTFLMRPGVSVYPSLNRLKLNLDMQLVNNPLAGSFAPRHLNLSRLFPSLKEFNVTVTSFSRQHRLFDRMTSPFTTWLEKFPANSSEDELELASQKLEERGSDDVAKAEVHLDCLDIVQSYHPWIQTYFSSSYDGKSQKTEFVFPSTLKAIPAQVLCDFGNREFLFRSGFNKSF